MCFGGEVSFKGLSKLDSAGLPNSQILRFHGKNIGLENAGSEDRKLRELAKYLHYRCLVRYLFNLVKSYYLCLSKLVTQYATVS